MEEFLYDEDFKRELGKDPHPFGEVTFLETIAAPGMTAVDIGANKGLTTVAVAKKVGTSGAVYAFEPVPDYYGVLTENLSRNQVQNVKAFQFALGREKGTVDYYKDGGGSGIVAMEGAEKIRVDVLSLDEFLHEEGIEDIDLFSMDCEGSELLVLQGGEQALLRGQARIFCEIHRGRLESLGQSLDELVHWLEERRFLVRPLLVDDLEKEVGFETCTHIYASRDSS